MINKRIILTGAHGTGKTTVLNMFKEQGYPVITEVVRKLSREQDIKINEMGDDSAQQIIFDTYLNELSADEYVSDRGLTDVLAYTMWLVNNDRVNFNVYIRQAMVLKKFAKENSDIVYFYFPIEFKLEDDGVRSVDPEFQKEIDRYLKVILDSTGINYIMVHGTPEERFQQILEIIN